MTNGYSPAMIDQVCSMALTYAHSEGRQAFEPGGPLEAMTTVEAGIAVGQSYAKPRSARPRPRGRPRRVLARSTRRTRSRRACRSASAAPPAATTRRCEVEDRFVKWRSEQVADLIWSLGAMAAEYVFYDQNTTGVGGDV